MLKRLFNLDWVIVGLVFILLFLGLFVLKSIFPSLFIQQLIWAIFGIFAFFIFSSIDYEHYEKLSWIFYFASIFFLLITFLFGAITRGSVRWLEIGGVGIQSSELVKPFLILFLATFLSDQRTDLKKIIYSGLLTALIALLIFLQPDLGSSLVVLFIWLGMILAKSIKGKWIVSGLVLLGLFFPLFWHFLKDYQKKRIFTFLNPSSDPLGSGFNLIQSKIAVGSGQLFGRGLGRGTQSHLQFLPERHTDFIFASLAEELGFIGSLILILLFFFLLLKILLLAVNSRDRFASLVCIGVFSLLFIQVFVNLGMNLGLLPITGLTLPLISYGGSSLLSTMIALGIISSIAKDKDKKRWLRLGRENIIIRSYEKVCSYKNRWFSM